MSTRQAKRRLRRRQAGLRAGLVGGGALAFALVPAGVAEAAAYKVTNLKDTGSGSLREADQALTGAVGAGVVYPMAIKGRIGHMSNHTKQTGRRGSLRAILATTAVITAVISSVLTLGAVAGAKVRPAFTDDAYCSQIPFASLPNENDLAFHSNLTGIQGASGSYARGRADLNAAISRATNGIACQVYRVKGYPYRLLLMHIWPRVIYHTHTAVMFGVPGNEIRLHVEVYDSTGPSSCKVGTVGVLTVFSSYDGVNKRLIKYVFPKACKTHDSSYTGSSVNTNVPPN
jgi:hypothetical protein